MNEELKGDFSQSSKRFNVNTFSLLNNVALKYRYEKMKLSEIASVICPNIKKTHVNLFQKIKKSSGHHIDHDIKVSQKILTKIKVKRISQGDYSYSPFVKKLKPVILDFSAEIAQRGAEAIKYHKDKLKSKKKMMAKGNNIFNDSQLSKTFDSVDDFINDVNEKYISNSNPKTQCETSKITSLNKKMLYKAKNRFKKDELKIVATSIKKKETALTNHYFKMKNNFIKEKNITAANDYNSSSKLLGNNEISQYIHSPNKIYKGRNMHLSELNSWIFYDSEDNNEKRETNKKKNKHQGLISNNTWAKTTSTYVNYMTDYQIKKTEEKIKMKTKNNQSIALMKSFKELKNINEKSYQRLKKEQEDCKCHIIKKGLGHIDGLNEKIIKCINTFDLNFTQKLQKINNKANQRGFSLKHYKNQ